MDNDDHDFNSQHYDHVVECFQTKYYNWQLRIGEMLFTGHRLQNNTTSVSTSSTGISSLSSFVKLGRVRDINGLFLEFQILMMLLIYLLLQNYKCYLNLLATNY